MRANSPFPLDHVMTNKPTTIYLAVQGNYYHFQLRPFEIHIDTIYYFEKTYGDEMLLKKFLYDHFDFTFIEMFYLFQRNETITKNREAWD